MTKHRLCTMSNPRTDRLPVLGKGVDTFIKLCHRKSHFTTYKHDSGFMDTRFLWRVWGKKKWLPIARFLDRL